MAASLTQASINTQLYALFTATDAAGGYLIPHELDIDIPQHRIKLHGRVGSVAGEPWVALGVAGHPRSVMFHLPISGGMLTYPLAEHESSAESNVDIAGLVYAFRVDLDLVALAHSDLAHHASIPSVVKQQLDHFTDDLFSISALFMDFQNADLASYDAAQSKIPVGLRDPTALRHFQIAMADHFSSLGHERNPWILGYSIAATKTADGGHPPSFQPTAATFSCSIDRANSDDNALTFLVMADGHPMPGGAPAGELPGDVITDDSGDGVFVLDSRLVLEDWLVPTVEHALDVRISRSGNEWSGSNTDGATNTIGGFPEPVIKYSDDQRRSVTLTLKNPSGSEAQVVISGSATRRIDASVTAVVTQSVYAAASVSFGGTITITAGTRGELAVTQAITVHDPVKSSGGADLLGDIEVWISKNLGIVDYAALLTLAATALATQIGQLVSGVATSVGALNSRFVMPAGGIFSFKDPQFSAEGDLTTTITFVTNEQLAPPQGDDS